MKRVVDGEWREWSGPMEELPVGASGVFETVLLQNGVPIFWAEHWQRFDAGCRFFGFVPPIGSTPLAEMAAQLAKDNGIDNGVIRFAAWKNVGRGLRTPPWHSTDPKDQFVAAPNIASPGVKRVAPNAPSPSAPSISSPTAGFGDPALQKVAWRLDVGSPRPHMSRREFRVGWGPAMPPATPDRAYKHLNRGAWMDALRAARAAGYDEVVLCDDTGHLVEGGVSNVFFVRDGILCTPSIESGALPGVMRAQLLTTARDSGLDVTEASFTRADLEHATEIWLTNSLLGVRPVVELAGRPLAPQAPVLDRVRAAWRARHGWDPLVVMPPSCS